MKYPNRVRIVMAVLVAVSGLSLFVPGDCAWTEESQPGTVRCGNLIYAREKTSVCFSSEFLKQIKKDTNIVVDEFFYPVKLESSELYEYPFCVMTGEGTFSLTQVQRDAIRMYLSNGGFIIASAGCSNRQWSKSFHDEIAKVYPDLQLQRLDRTHPVFSTVYKVDFLDLGGGKEAFLEGLEIDGKVVLIFTSDGLNDSGKVSDDCCCCGGNEIDNARQVNANLLAYTLTH